MKEWLLRCGLAVAGAWFRHLPRLPGNETLFDRLVGRGFHHFLCRTPIAVTVTTRFGARMVVQPDQMVDGRICFFGLWEPAITRYIERGLVPGDGFIDVGANIGYYSLLAAGCVGPQGRVHAIEASPSIFARLAANLALNRLDRVSARNLAVTGESGPVAVYLHAAHNRGNTTIMASQVSALHRQEAVVEGLPLPAIIPWDEVAAARFIKIDVEGAEWAVVQSIRHLLPRLSARTEILLEVTRDAVAAAGGTVAELVAAFAEAGFAAFRIENTYSTRDYTGPVSDRLMPFTDFAAAQADLVFKRPG